MNYCSEINMAVQEQLPCETVGQPEGGQAVSAQMLKSKGPFDPIHQNYTATDFKLDGSQDLEMADNMSNERIQRSRDKAPPDVDELASAPLVDLSSTSHIMDAILNNLQGLTPGQEAVRRQIEERSRLVQEQAKRIQQASTPASSVAASEGGMPQPGGEEPVPRHGPSMELPPRKSAQHPQGLLANDLSEMQQRTKLTESSADRRRRQRHQLKEELGRDLRIGRAQPNANGSEIEVKPLFEETPHSRLNSNGLPNSLAKNATDHAQTLRAEDQFSGLSSQVPSLE